MLSPREMRVAYRLRWKRRRLLMRALRSRRQLNSVMDRTKAIVPGQVLAFSTIRNEIDRLPFFLNHYRALGVDHFLMIDNASEDASAEYLRDQDDVSLWQTDASYKASRFGVDWTTWLQIKYGHGHWTLTLDADELLIYPYWDTRDLGALTRELDRDGVSSFGAMMLDLYPQGRLSDAHCAAGDDPSAVLNWFDAGNYTIQKQAPMGNLWIQGGPRARSFFASDPRRAPTLNKVPLVKWSRRFAYVNSTHSILPRRLNEVYAQDGGERLSGILLHTKFLSAVIEKSKEEKQRQEHFSNSVAYDDYYDAVADDPVLWTPKSTQYRGWRHLESIGLMSRGSWM